MVHAYLNMQRLRGGTCLLFGSACAVFVSACAAGAATPVAPNDTASDATPRVDVGLDAGRTDANTPDAAVDVSIRDGAAADAVIDTGASDAGNCRRDYLEPNDTPLASSQRTLGQTDTDSLMVSIHATGDQDWYHFAVNDSVLYHPDLFAEIRDAPTGTDLSLEAIFTCDNGAANDSLCPMGTRGDYNQGGIQGKICRSESAASSYETVQIDTDCGGTFDDEDGQFHVHVYSATPPTMCFTYRLNYGEFSN